MLPFPVLIEHSLIYGSILSVVMTIIILTSLYLRPQIWLDDAPADLKAAVGPMSERDKRIRRFLGVPTMLFVGGLLIHAILRLASHTGGQVHFVDVAVSTFLIIQVFNLVDLLIIDWL